MRQKTLLALALLLAALLPGLAAASDQPLPLPGPAALSTAAPLALCAAPTTVAPQGLPPNPAREVAVGVAEVTCSSYCGQYQCLGYIAGSAICGTSAKLGTCTAATDICSTDGRARCFCKFSRDN